jgi:hypothetical protein
MGWGGGRSESGPNLIKGFGLLSYVPPTWTYECDEDLIHFLYDHLGKEDENLGSVKQYVDSIDVSSYTVGVGTPYPPTARQDESHPSRLDPELPPPNQGQTRAPTGHTQSSSATWKSYRNP